MSGDTVLICQVVDYSVLVHRISVWKSGLVLRDSPVQGLKIPKGHMDVYSLLMNWKKSS